MFIFAVIIIMLRHKAGIGYGLTKSKPEYADLVAAVRAGSVDLEEVRGICGGSNGVITTDRYHSAPEVGKAASCCGRVQTDKGE